MTTDQIRIACAEEMGWETHKFIDASGSAHVGWRSAQLRVACTASELPNYPTDANAALELCEQMRSDGWWMEMRPMVSSKKWKIYVWDRTGDTRIYHAEADTLPLAICEAFLKVRGKWEDECQSH
jgi:hypothetical protein